MRGRLLTFFVALTCIAAPAKAADVPPEMAAVQKYVLEKDYPEIFENPYRMRVDGALVSDLDGDGLPEVISQTWPHFRQSAPLTIFRVAPSLQVTRVIEGLAPGPLVPISGDYLDSHALRLGFDLVQDGAPSDAKTRAEVIALWMKRGFSGVAYKNFYHLDKRLMHPENKTEAGVYYVDMTHIANPPASQTCESFEFSRIRGSAAGPVEGLGKGNILASWAGPTITLYRIREILPSGLLDKQLWQVDMPTDFEGFDTPFEGPVKIIVGGKTKPLAVNCNDATGVCTLRN